MVSQLFLPVSTAVLLIHLASRRTWQATTALQIWRLLVPRLLVLLLLLLILLLRLPPLFLPVAMAVPLLKSASRRAWPSTTALRMWRLLVPRLLVQLMFLLRLLLRLRLPPLLLPSATAVLLLQLASRRAWSAATALQLLRLPALFLPAATATAVLLLQLQTCHQVWTAESALLMWQLFAPRRLLPRLPQLCLPVATVMLLLLLFPHRLQLLWVWARLPLPPSRPCLLVQPLVL